MASKQTNKKRKEIDPKKKTTNEVKQPIPSKRIKVVTECIKSVETKETKETNQTNETKEIHDVKETKETKETTSTTPNVLEGMLICLTGHMKIPRPVLINHITNHGGKISAIPTQNTTHLVCVDPDGKTDKLQKARAKGVQIVNEKWLLDKINTATATQSISLQSTVADTKTNSSVNTTTPTTITTTTITEATTPQLLLANKWDDNVDPKGWWISEKLDGVRAFWDGTQFVSRIGNAFFSPEWFTKGYPDASSGITFDGELFTARGDFNHTVGIVKSKDDRLGRWSRITFRCFDIPSMKNDAFESRMIAIKQWSDKLNVTGQTNCGKFKPVPQVLCESKQHMQSLLERVLSFGGEGLMLRQAKSQYVGSRSSTLLKVKMFHDAEARVLEYVAGKGKHVGVVGSLRCELPNGKTFQVGSGLNDAERAEPPKIGSIITYKFQELTPAGIPRFPTFVGVRIDAQWPPQNDPILKKTQKTNIDAIVEQNGEMFARALCNTNELRVMLCGESPGMEGAKRALYFIRKCRDEAAWAGRASFEAFDETPGADLFTSALTNSKLYISVKKLEEDALPLVRALGELFLVPYLKSMPMFGSDRNSFGVWMFLQLRSYPLYVHAFLLLSQTHFGIDWRNARHYHNGETMLSTMLRSYDLSRFQTDLNPIWEMLLVYTSSDAFNSVLQSSLSDTVVRTSVLHLAFEHLPNSPFPLKQLLLRRADARALDFKTGHGETLAQRLGKKKPQNGGGNAKLPIWYENLEIARFALSKARKSIYMKALMQLSPSHTVPELADIITSYIE